MEVQKYSLKLKDKKEIARETWAFYFEKPKGLTFAPGQSMRLYRARSDEGKTFSIASAPHEEDLVFAMRMRGSPFKKSLSGVSVGEEVEAEGPHGERFILHEDTKIPAVFIAGGIGVTPFISILSHITHEQMPYPVTLFYSNRQEGDIAFLPKLTELGSVNKKFKLVLLVTRNAPLDFEGERERFNERLLRHFVSDIEVPIYYISGTPEMVVSVRHLLENIGINAEHIVTKKFTGY